MGDQSSSSSMNQLSEEQEKLVLEFKRPSVDHRALFEAVLQNLDTDVQKAAAQTAVDTLSPQDQQDLAATVVQNLDTDLQKAAAQTAVDTLSPRDQQDLAATVVQNLDTDRQKAAAQTAVDTLSPQDQQDLAESVLGIPDRKTQQQLWFIVIWAMVAAIFVFGTMAFVLIYQKKSAEAPLALATTALGGIVGLVATSPGSRRSR